VFSAGCGKNVLSSFLIDALQTTAVNVTDARPQNTSGHAPKVPARITLGGIDLRKFLKQILTPNGSHVTGYWIDAAGVHGDHIRSSYGPRIPGTKELNDTYPAMELSGSDASFSSSEDNIHVFDWHGEIKPENILRFTEDTAHEHRLLVITNFGLPTLDIEYRLYEAVDHWNLTSLPCELVFDCHQPDYEKGLWSHFELTTLANYTNQYFFLPMLRKQCQDGTTTQSPYQCEVPRSSIIKQIKNLDG
jgi:hypothetical protein